MLVHVLGLWFPCSVQKLLHLHLHQLHCNPRASTWSCSTDSSDEDAILKARLYIHVLPAPEIVPKTQISGCHLPCLGGRQPCLCSWSTSLAWKMQQSSCSHTTKENGARLAQLLCAWALYGFKKRKSSILIRMSKVHGPAQKLKVRH